MTCKEINRRIWEYKNDFSFALSLIGGNKAKGTYLCEKKMWKWTWNSQYFPFISFTNNHDSFSFQILFTDNNKMYKNDILIGL